MIEHNQFAPLAPNRLQQIDVAFAANRIMGHLLIRIHTHGTVNNRPQVQVEQYGYISPSARVAIAVNFLP